MQEINGCEVVLWGRTRAGEAAIVAAYREADEPSDRWVVALHVDGTDHWHRGEYLEEWDDAFACWADLVKREKYGFRGRAGLGQ